MGELREFLSREVLFHRTVEQVLLCLLGLLGTVLGRWVLVTLAETKFKKWAEKTAATWDDLLLKKARRPVGALIVVVGFYASLHILQPNDPIAKWLGALATISAGIIAAFLVVGIVDVLIEAYRPIAEKTASRLDDMLIPIVSRILKTLLVFVAFVMVLDHLGVKITALVTTAGVSGIAIAFGAQKVISNFFASITIFSDQPFQISERIRVSGISGVVEEIGLRSTKIRDDDGVLVTVPNLILAEGVVENFSRRSSRRVVMKIGVTYDTSPEKMRLAQEILSEILKAEPAVEERHLTSFVNFSDWSLDIQIIYWVKGLTPEILLAVQHGVNSEILRRFAESGIEMAFPTRTIFHKQAT